MASNGYPNGYRSEARQFYQSPGYSPDGTRLSNVPSAGGAANPYGWLRDFPPPGGPNVRSGNPGTGIGWNEGRQPWLYGPRAGTLAGEFGGPRYHPSGSSYLGFSTGRWFFGRAPFPWLTVAQGLYDLWMLYRGGGWSSDGWEYHWTCNPPNPPYDTLAGQTVSTTFTSVRSCPTQQGAVGTLQAVGTPLANNVRSVHVWKSGIVFGYVRYARLAGWTRSWTGPIDPIHLEEPIYATTGGPNPFPPEWWHPRDYPAPAPVNPAIDPDSLPIARPGPTPDPLPWFAPPKRRPNPVRVYQSEWGNGFWPMPWWNPRIAPWGAPWQAPKQQGRAQPKTKVNPEIDPGMWRQAKTTTFGPGLRRPDRDPRGRHYLRPPRANERERKVMITVRELYDVANWAINQTTETLDAVDAIWKALPQPEGRRKPNTAARIRELYERWDEVPLGQALANLVENAIEDWIIGTLGKGAGELARKSGAAHGYSVTRMGQLPMPTAQQLKEAFSS